MTTPEYKHYQVDLDGKGISHRKATDDFHYINRKEDRFAFSKRRQLSGTTVAERKWKRWVNAFVLSATIKTPSYNPIPTINFFASGKDLVNPSTASKGVGNFTSRPHNIVGRVSVKSSKENFFTSKELDLFTEEFTSLLDRNNIEHDFASLVSKYDLGIAIKIVSYPLITHIKYAKDINFTGASAIPRMVSTVCRARTEEQFVNYFGFKSSQLNEAIRSLYTNKTLTINQLTYLEIMNTVYSEQEILQVINTEKFALIPITEPQLFSKPEQIRGMLRKVNFATFLNVLEKASNPSDFRFLENEKFPPEPTLVDLWTKNYKSLRASKTKLTDFNEQTIKEYIKSHTIDDEAFDEITAPLAKLKLKCIITHSCIEYEGFKFVIDSKRRLPSGFKPWSLSAYTNFNKNSFLYNEMKKCTYSLKDNQNLFRSLADVVNIILTIEKLVLKQFELAGIEFNVEQGKLVCEKLVYLHKESSVSRFKGIPRKSYLKLVKEGVSDELAFDLMLNSVSFEASKQFAVGEDKLPTSWIEDMFVTKKMYRKVEQVTDTL
jgi:hypothetical protein